MASLSNVSMSELKLALPGEDSFLSYPGPISKRFQDDPPMVWHGSSVALIAKATTLLNEEFSDIDPEEDFEKWRNIGARPYFITVLETSQVMTCCLRCVLDGDWSSSSNKTTQEVCTRRLVVDFLCTVEECQGRGYASQLLEMVIRLAETNGANCYVVALEDSCVYWMSKGFILEDGPINRRLNGFRDTHLLKLPTNLPEDPYCIPPPNESSDEDTSGSDMDDDDDDDDLQKVILKSLLHQ